MSKFLSHILCFALLASLSACGSGGSSSSPKTSGTPIITGANTAPLIVDTGPDPTMVYTVNEVFTSVTICDSAVGGNCQTIDHILVDTGSSGLRILSSVLSPALNLSQQTDGSNPIGECGLFVDGYTWGPVKLATMKIANQVAYDIPIQVIGDSTFSTVPTACDTAGSGNALNTVDSFGAKGLLGVGNFLQDCGPFCVSNISNGIYYSCNGADCTSIAMPLDQQLPNPVAKFDADNNGVIVNLPAIPAGGAANVTGSLVFGVDTQSNNQLNGTPIYTVTTNSGLLTTTFNGQTLPNSFIDSGSNALYFPAGTLSSTLTICSSLSFLYCPPFTQDFSAVIQGTNSAQANINFSVANAESLIAYYGITAFNNLAGPDVASGFDWGLPFFYGRNVYVVIEGKDVGGSTGPFIAF